MLDHRETPAHGAETPELSRVELLRIARTLQVSDADVMTRAELRAAIDKANRPEPRPKVQPVTWVSVARRLLASIVEQGLHLPDAAALIRGDTTLSSPPKAPPPVATVTLARIYAAQGHLARAIGTLNEVLSTDADHDLARDLRAQLEARLEAEQQRIASGELVPPRVESSSSAPPPPTATVAATETAVEIATDKIAAADSAPAVNSAASAPAPSVEAEAARAANGAARVGPNAAPAAALAPADTPPASLPESIPPTIQEPSPRAAELVIIEAGRCAYVYWELAWPRSTPSTEPHWISVVSHSATGVGCERSERQYPVLENSGALRIEGLPRHAIVRAKLTRDNTSSGPPLVVAGSVRTQLAEVDPEPKSPVSAALEQRFAPHCRSNPKASARRALDHLDKAGPAYW